MECFCYRKRPHFIHHVLCFCAITLLLVSNGSRQTAKATSFVGELVIFVGSLTGYWNSSGHVFTASFHGYTFMQDIDDQYCKFVTG